MHVTDPVHRWYPGSVVVAMRSDEGSVNLLTQLMEANSMSLVRLNITRSVLA